MRQFKPGQLQTGSIYPITASSAVTASYANIALSASYAISASYEINYETSSSYAETASFAQSASYALTASYTLGLDTGSLTTTASFNAFTASYTTGSFTGSFTGDGSQLTGIVSSKWTGSNPISRQSDVEITGSLRTRNTLGSGINTFLGQLSYGDTASVDWKNAYLKDQNDITSIDWQLRKGNDSFGIRSFNWDSRYTSDSNGNVSIDWEIRQLLDSNEDTVLDWENGLFTGSIHGTASWANNAVTASFITTAQTASYVLNAVSSSYALTSSYSNISTSSSYASSSSYTLSSSYSISSSFSQTSSYINPLHQNVIITGSIYIPDNTHGIYFSGSAAASKLSWNDTDGTLDLGLKGGNVTLQLGQEQVVRVVNKTGANLLESQYNAVRIRRVDEGGSQGQRLAIVLAQANNDANSVDTLGIVTENIDVNQEGFITNSGLVRNINTTGTLQGETWTDGDVLYLSPTIPGALTTTKPQAPNHTVIMGYVVYAHNNQGKIFVKVDNGYEIDELHNVRITTASLAAGQLLVRSGSNATGVWINTNQLTGSYGLTGSLTATSITASNLYAGATYISGSLIVNGQSTFYGTASFVNVTASNLFVSESFISVNVFEPVERFGGLKVYDSGSSAATASLAWDSLHNHWVYQNVDGATYTGGMLLSGPRNTGSLGDEPNLTIWFVARSDGGDHLNDSQIFTSGSTTQITGSLTVTEGVTASFTGSYTGDGTGLYNIPASGIVGLNLSQIASGSVSASISPNNGLQVNTNVTATSFTGSLFGTASWADQAVTASYIVTAQTASYVLNSISSSFATSASFSVSSSQAVTSSFVTASNVIGTVISASFAETASYLIGGITIDTGSLVTTASFNAYTGSAASQFAGTASFVQTAQTASYVLNAVSSSYALSASYAPASIPSGPWGISNSSGVYTYYASLSASIAAASAGQVVEMFADITATSVVTLKPNVTIQGNGHTYTYSGNTGDVFTTPPSSPGTYTYYFNNININRANTATSTGAIFAGDGTGFTTALNFKCSATRVTYTTTTGTAPIFRPTGSFSIYGCMFDGIDVVGNTSGYLFDSSFAVNNIKNSKLENTGTGGCITTPNITGNCFHENNYIKTNSGNGIFCNYAGDTIKNCIVISNSGNAIAGQSGATAYNCFAFSNTGKAFAGMVCYGCTGQTTTGNAYYQSSAYNSSGRSTTGYTIRPFSGMSRFYNSSFYSSGTITVYDTDYGTSFYNCSIITDYNNAAGHAISIGPSSGNPDFVNNYIQVANTSANCIKSTPSTFSAQIVKNTYKGAATPVNTNVVQLETNTQDNQGNIIL